MFLWLIILLVLIVDVASYFLLEKLIVQNFEKDREQNRLRQNTFVEKVKDINLILSKIIIIEQQIVEQQNALDKKMDALSSFMNKRNNYVTLQQEQFERLAKADILAARREELLRAKELKVALERLMGVAMTSRQPPSPNDVVAIENLTNRIQELERILATN